MINFKEETLKYLEVCGKSWDDVIAVCGCSFQISKEKFIELADVDYDNGCGDQLVASDLKIIGKDFYMEREEYDGSENWAFRTMPDLSNIPFNNDVVRLIKPYNDEYLHLRSLKEINDF